MNEIYIRKRIKARVEEFNNKQDSFGFHVYIFKCVMAFIILCIFLVVAPVLAALFTPMFMSNTPASNAISLSYSAIILSALSVSVIFYFAHKKKVIHSKRETVENTYNEFHKPNQNRFNRFLSFFQFVNKFIALIFSSIITPIKPHPSIYLDPNSYNILIDLILKLSETKNNIVEYEYLNKYSEEFSFKWISNLIQKSEVLEIVKVFINETEKKFILLNLDFYDPSNTY